MTAFTFRMPFGIPGDISRASIATVEAQPFGATAFPSYGVPVKLVAGLVVPISAIGDAIYGILVRPFPTQGANASDPLGTSVPPTTGIANILRRGYITIFNNLNGTNAAAPVGQVYIWAAASGAGHIQGSFEAAATGGSTTTALIPATFMSAADASGFVEIAYNI
jgi:hypothetical protein